MPQSFTSLVFPRDCQKTGRQPKELCGSWGSPLMVLCCPGMMHTIFTREMQECVWLLIVLLAL